VSEGRGGEKHVRQLQAVFFSGAAATPYVTIEREKGSKQSENTLRKNTIKRVATGEKKNQVEEVGLGSAGGRV